MTGLWYFCFLALGPVESTATISLDAIILNNLADLNGEVQLTRHGILWCDCGIVPLTMRHSCSNTSFQAHSVISSLSKTRVKNYLANSQNEVQLTRFNISG